MVRPPELSYNKRNGAGGGAGVVGTTVVVVVGTSVVVVGTSVVVVGTSVVVVMGKNGIWGWGRNTIGITIMTAKTHAIAIPMPQHPHVKSERGL
jgi:hypothetical protein